MNRPAPQVGDGFFGLFALHTQLLRRRDVKLRKDLDANCSGLFLEKACHQIDSLLVFEARAPLMRIDENFGTDELNAHAIRPASTGSCLESLDRARCVSSPGSAAWPFAFETTRR